MDIKKAEFITTLVNTRNELTRASEILACSISKKFINTDAAAELSAGRYNVTLSKSTISQLLVIMDERINKINEFIANTNADE